MRNVVKFHFKKHNISSFLKTIIKLFNLLVKQLKVDAVSKQKYSCTQLNGHWLTYSQSKCNCSCRTSSRLNRFRNSGLTLKVSSGSRNLDTVLFIYKSYTISLILAKKISGSARFPPPPLSGQATKKKTFFAASLIFLP